MKESYKQGLLQFDDLDNYKHHIFPVHPGNLRTSQMCMAIVLHPRDDKFTIEIGTKEYSNLSEKSASARELSMPHMLP